MKSWLKNSTVPAIFLIALALGTLWICFLLATHRHTGIFKTIAPPGPQHTVTLTWKASTTAGVSYNVYRRDSSGTVKLNPQPLTATTYVDRNVQPGQTYHYLAKAVNPNGTESAASNEVVVTVPSP